MPRLTNGTVHFNPDSIETMALESFTFDSDLTESFLGFGYDLYRDDLHWIPPPRRELRAQFEPTFSFYGKKGNAHRHFVSARGGRVVGRVSAMMNRDLKIGNGRPTGIFGFFDCIPDYAVAEELLGAASAWLADQGAGAILGPMNFDIWHGYRVMTQGFDREPFYGEPYNKAYYPAFLTRFGFTAERRWNSVEVTGRGDLESMIERGSGRF